MGGINAPPAMAVHRTPEPSGFKFPKSSMAMLKMVGNIMELNNPAPTIDHNAAIPEVEILINTQQIANEANTVNTKFGLKTLVR